MNFKGGGTNQLSQLEIGANIESAKPLKQSRLSRIARALRLRR